MQYCVANGCLGRCLEPDAKAHFGLCPGCFLALSHQDVSRLSGVPVLDVVERVRVVYPARSWLETACLWLWRLGMTAGLIYLAVRR